MSEPVLCVWRPVGLTGSTPVAALRLEQLQNSEWVTGRAFCDSDAAFAELRPVRIGRGCRGPPQVASRRGLVTLLAFLPRRRRRWPMVAWLLRLEGR